MFMKKSFLTFQIEQKQAIKTKSFIYRTKKFPFNFDLMKQNSNYFIQKQGLYQNIDEIPLLNQNEEEYVTISEETIRLFISCCQNERCQICTSNIFELQYLSAKYDVIQLTKAIDTYISENWSNQVINSLLFKIQFQKTEIEKWEEKFSDTSNEEKILGTNLNDYIDKKELLSFPIPILYKILNYTSFFKIEFVAQVNDIID